MPLSSLEAMYRLVVDKRGSITPGWPSLRSLKDQLPPEVRMDSISFSVCGDAW
jgi:hypothetical protein